MDGMESTRLKQKESRELAKARMIVFQEEERAKDGAIAINRARKARSTAQKVVGAQDGRRKDKAHE